MGKSLLLSEAAGTAETEGVSLAAAAADKLSQFMPLQPLLVALKESPVILADEASPRNIANLPIRLAGTLRASLERRVSASPLLVSLDDLQWADPTTLQALRTLPQQLTSCPLSWILTRRSPGLGNEAGLLFDLLESGGATRIRLRPLGDDAVAGLITDALGAMPGPDLLVMAEGAAGNPLMLTELAAGLFDENALIIRDGRAGLASACMPGRIQAMVHDTLTQLGTQTRQLLEMAAVLGRSFQLEEAAEMLGASPATLLPRVQEALDTRVLATTRDALAFRHELVRQAICESIPLPVRQALHGQFGDILLSRGGPARLVAAHLLSSTRSGDSRTLVRLDRAAAEFLPSSPASAADLAARALELTPSGDPEILARSVTAAGALTAAGRLEEAARLARSALAIPQATVTSARLRCTLSSALSMSGQADEAMIEAEQLLAEPRLPSEVHADATIALLQALTGLRDNRRASFLAEAILARRDEERADVVIAALVALAITRWDTGRLADALDLAADAVRRAAGQPPDAWQFLPYVGHFRPYMFLASRLVDLRRFGEAQSVIRAAPDHIDALGPIGWSATPVTLHARMALAAGRLDDAVAAAEAALGRTRTPGPSLRDPVALAVLATVALRRGDLNTAAHHMGNTTQRSHFRSACLDTWGTVVSAQVDEARNGPRAALDMLADVYANLREHRFPLLCDPACAAWLTRTALAGGDQQRAQLAAAVADEIARGNPAQPVTAASAAHARGICGRDPPHLQEAAAGHPDQWARASAAEDLGTLLTARGNRRGAIACLDQALNGYAATGAARDVARIHRRLRRLGIRRRHWAAESRPASGWGSLTGTERTVSKLVAQGLTNQQVADQMFISGHTVAFHLRQVYRKLDICSRVGLTRIAVEHAQHQPPDNS
jgi:DNA-binding CsgD family transcriptional regulator/tetratricopeptide (TPR) repeat protein